MPASTLYARAMDGLVVVAVACAVVSTVVMLRRSAGPRVVPANAAPTIVRDWKDYQTGGHLIGSPHPKLTLVEFADYECPYCRRFALGPMKYVLERHPDVSLILRQRPMAYHRFAYPSARAAECAAAQGRFAAYEALLYRDQDSLGLKSFHQFASEAGVPDLVGFDRCDADRTKLLGVEADIAAADKIGINATPSLLIDSLLVRGAIDSATLERYVTDALRGSPAR